MYPSTCVVELTRSTIHSALELWLDASKPSPNLPDASVAAGRRVVVV